MRKSGEITVFLSMCLLCISALLCVMLESARTAGSRYYFQVAVNRSLDTLFSQYHRRLWDEYRVFALEYESEEEITRELECYIDEYLSADNWYPMRIEEVNVTRLTGIADSGGECLKEEVLRYMKYGAAESFFIKPEQGEQFLKDITEAASVHALSGAFDKQERAARKLEEAAEKLVANVQEQKQAKDAITGALETDSESSFFREAERYRKTAKKYPKLMRQYEKCAQALAELQRQSQTGIEKASPDLQDNREELFRRQWDPYNDYIAQDGQRRQEFAGWENVVEHNRMILDETEMMVEAGREGGDDEEDFGLEEAAHFWKQQYTDLDVHVKSSPKDKEKQNLLDQVKRLAEGGLLEAVMPEGTVISSETLPSGEFPSRDISGKISGKSESRTGMEAVWEQVLTDEYCGLFFTCARSPRKHRIQYEQEYLLKGAGSDRENLERTVTELFAVRQGLNLIHILSDAGKRQEAEALALVITGSTGMAPLAKIVSCMIMGIWAMAESVQDLRILMDGGKVPLWKQSDDWNMNLEAVLDLGRGIMPDTNGSEGKGFDYGGYLKLLLLKQDPQIKYMRMLDVMQMSIGQEEPGFSISNCAYRADICGKAYGKHVFFALPFVRRFAGGREGYTVKAAGEKAY